jgi:hypothetical protein
MAGRSSSDEVLRPPSGLRAAGRRLWSAVVSKYVLTPAELANLAEACRTKDELVRLEKAVRALPDLTTTGSTGQPKAHPLLEEVRRHRVLLERLTAALALPNEDEEGAGLRPAQKQALKAINARWAAVNGKTVS